MKNKKGMEFSWLFAVIVGAIILFLAFYFITTNVTTQEMKGATEEVHSLEVLFNPFAYLGAMGAITSKPIVLPDETRLEFECDTYELGSNTIILDSGVPKEVYDKYIFADDLESKEIHTISKPLILPWRVADLIYVFPKNQHYCFIDAPIRLIEELENLNVSNLFFDELDCPEEGIRICFGGAGCDILVSSSRAYSQGYVRKQGSSPMYFAGDNFALMLGAIFSRDDDYYNCNVKRLAKRLDLEINVYKDKQAALLTRGCSSNVNLDSFKQAVLRIKELRENQGRIPITEQLMSSLYSSAQSVEFSNSNSQCPLF
ncbi:MAG: hypothetical protein JSW08_02615 [archaeon]|nr:MAG: hypothetical protein JSW08_02615 [archaeon]